jgi:hypothetical protein
MISRADRLRARGHSSSDDGAKGRGSAGTAREGSAGGRGAACGLVVTPLRKADIILVAACDPADLVNAAQAPAAGQLAEGVDLAPGTQVPDDCALGGDRRRRLAAGVGQAGCGIGEMAGRGVDVGLGGPAADGQPDRGQGSAFVQGPSRSALARARAGRCGRPTRWRRRRRGRRQAARGRAARRC